MDIWSTHAQPKGNNAFGDYDRSSVSSFIPLAMGEQPDLTGVPSFRRELRQDSSQSTLGGQGGGSITIEKSSHSQDLVINSASPELMDMDMDIEHDFTRDCRQSATPLYEAVSPRQIAFPGHPSTVSRHTPPPSSSVSSHQGNHGNRGSTQQGWAASAPFDNEAGCPTALISLDPVGATDSAQATSHHQATSQANKEQSPSSLSVSLTTFSSLRSTGIDSHDAVLVQAPTPTPTPTKRQCEICNAWKPRESWHKKQWSKSGRCIECLNKQQDAERRQRAESKRNREAAAVGDRKQQVTQQRKLELERKATKKKEKVETKEEQSPSHLSSTGAKGSLKERAGISGIAPIGSTDSWTPQDATTLNTSRTNTDTNTDSTTINSVNSSTNSSTSSSTTATAQGGASASAVTTGQGNLRASRTKRGREEETAPTSVRLVPLRAASAGAADRALAPSTRTGVPRNGMDARTDITFGMGGGMDVVDGTDGKTALESASKRSRLLCAESQLQGSPRLEMVATRDKYRIRHYSSFLKQPGEPGDPGRAARCSQGSPIHNRASVNLVLPPMVEPPALLDQPPPSPSLVVIDGSNVAFAYRESLSSPEWSPQGILLALKFFQQRGVAVVAFVPRPRVDKIEPHHEHYEAIKQATNSGAIALVPSRSNDDLFILSYAVERKSHIVTNDLFRDHTRNVSTLDSLGLNAHELKFFLSEHHVSYTFVRDEFIPNPEAAIIRVLTRQACSLQRLNGRKGDPVTCVSAPTATECTARQATRH